MLKVALYLIITLVLCGIFFFVTKSFILTISICLMYLIFFFLIYHRKYIAYKEKKERTFEAISFINNFVIALSVNDSIRLTYESMKEKVSPSLKLQMDSIEHLDVATRIEYLNNYFNLPLYGVFINIINQYIECGTNILEISQILIHDTRNLENRLADFDLKIRKKEKDFLISWGFTFLTLALIELSLSSFVNEAKSSMEIYPILIFAYYVFFIIIYMLFSLKIYDTSFIFKGEKPHEKIKDKNRKAESKL